MNKLALFLSFFLNIFSGIAQVGNKQFLKIQSEYSRVDFVNKIDLSVCPSPQQNMNVFDGGGIAVGDINNDGLVDLYFTSNAGDDKLYLNLGNFKFRDITRSLGKQDGVSWKTGVTMVDVNNDGYLDIYVCCSGIGNGESRKNKLYINNGNLSFVEAAEKFGIADSGYSTQATFFDFDQDGDLDLYVLNNGIGISNDLNVKKNEVDELVGDKLYQNENGFFIDITKKAGISQNSISMGLGVIAADINNDGWADLYVANDLMEHDYIYINNHDGTFKEKSDVMLGHMPITSMGCDIADFNNDGLLDIMTLDMLPESQERQNLFLSQDNYEMFSIGLKNGFQYQYMRNMMQINNGDETFSEIGQLAGVSNTDWSWSPLFADFNNDGFKDLFIATGFLLDVNNRDFIKFTENTTNGKIIGTSEFKELLKKAPSTKLPNYIFENNKNLTFSKKNFDWGIDDVAFSNGAVYADLDNDGDLDIVVNVINSPALIYKNQCETINKNNWIEFELIGESKNKNGYGAKISIYSNGITQFIENTATRGFQSSITDVIHFGLGSATLIDSIKIVWNNGKVEKKVDIKCNQKLILNEKNSVDNLNTFFSYATFFKVDKQYLNYVHEEGNENDFKRQYLLNCMFSKIGPHFKSADINNDGYIDYFAFGSTGSYGILFSGDSSNKFVQIPLSEKSTQSRVSSAAFLDADNDGDLDLYLAMGGYANYVENDSDLQDVLFLNDGRGNFTMSPNALPLLRSSKSVVTTLDFNNDGYKDLFIGGRVVPGSYPLTPESYLLQNNGNGHFVDVTKEICPSLSKAGMVTDAISCDINNDRIPDLITVGEWMNIEIWEGNKKGFTNKTNQYFDKSYQGWWNTIYATDIDDDGDLDIIAGNVGLNTPLKTEISPIKLLYADFDNNQAVDPFLCFTHNGNLYPFATRDELNDQIFGKRSKFTTYKSYATASVKDIFSPEELLKADTLIADYFKTTLFINEGGKFKVMELPMEAQFSPVHKIVVADVNKDNKKDILLFGNESNYKLRLGKSDANYGMLLINKGNHFEYIPPYKSGLSVKGDVRDAWFDNKTKQLNIGINGGALKTYKLK